MTEPNHCCGCTRYYSLADQDANHAVEEEVRADVICHLKGASAIFLQTMDDDSASDEKTPGPARKKNKGTSGKLQTVDNTVINWIRCGDGCEGGVRKSVAFLFDVNAIAY